MFLEILPPELHIQLLTFLRATDLSSLQQTCRVFNNHNLVRDCILHFTNHIYPAELCEGFDTPSISGELEVNLNNYETLRNIEMLVAVRVLSSPEPSISERQKRNGNYYFVSKKFCRDTLKYLNALSEKREQQREQNALAQLEAAAKAEASASGKKVKYVHRQKPKKNKKKLKKNGRVGGNNLELSPPTPDVNIDIICVHNNLKPCASERSSRSKRRLMDKQAWRVLKKLYPRGVQLSLLDGECLQCVMENETDKRNREMVKQKATEERRKPLSCNIVRGIYNRRTGVPKHCLFYQEGEASEISSPAKKPNFLRNGAVCPLMPGVYTALPRAWCHRWRKYIKNGEGGRPPAPDASLTLCEGHQLPLIPPHLESYLRGETAALLDTATTTIYDDGSSTPSSQQVTSPIALPVGFAPVSQQLGGRTRSISSNTTVSSLGNHSVQALRSVPGVSEAELQLQQLAMLQIEETFQNTPQQHAARLPNARRIETPMSPEGERSRVNEQLDRENRVVVEILTDEEMEALERWWPGIHSCYALKFVIVELDLGTTDIVWTTDPCRDCDASGRCSDMDFVARNRCRAWANNTPQKKKY